MLDRCNVYGQVGLWIRAVYKEGFKNKTITAVVRAGDRTNPDDFKCIPEGVDMPVRFIKRPGDASRDINAELYPDDGTTIRRVGVIVKRIGDLTEEDLSGTTPDTATPELVRYHLAMINNTSLPPLDDVVTIWRLEYQPNAIE